MNCKQNQRINQVKESTLVVGIDIGSTTHYARAFDWRGIELGKVFQFSNSREGFENFKTANQCSHRTEQVGHDDNKKCMSNTISIETFESADIICHFFEVAYFWLA